MMSSSLSNEVGGLLKDWLKNPLNASFLYWYFLPAVGFVLLQLFVIVPAFGYAAPEVVPQKDDLQTATLAGQLVQLLRASVFWLVVLPLITGVVMSSLSGTTLRLFRGMLPIARLLFSPWITRNRRQSVALFGDLRRLRRQYLFLTSLHVKLESVDGKEQSVPVDEAQLPDELDKLKLEIQAWHDTFETRTENDEAAGTMAAPGGEAKLLEGPPIERELPIDPNRVGPNKFANTLAVAEEYAFERYGMDASVFWPRVSAEIEGEKLDSLTATYGAMRGLLNLSLLAMLFALECFIVVLAFWQAWVSPMDHVLLRARWFLLASIVSVLIGLAAYRGAVSAARAVGNAMRTAFDYYRGNVLRRFNLKMPEDLDEERVLWLKLSAFIRRGESFYYPSDYRREAET
jgi:hypothetical protein